MVWGGERGVAGFRFQAGWGKVGAKFLPMKMQQIPFGTTDWSQVPAERKAGETGWADWRVRQFGEIRVRMLEYSPGYRADHWCVKGHILFCLEGELVTELADGRVFTLRPGMSYQVADQAEPHRSFTARGAKLFVVD
jgi:quercetin dioxygenase-like cupin family protein